MFEVNADNDGQVNSREHITPKTPGKMLAMQDEVIVTWFLGPHLENPV